MRPTCRRCIRMGPTRVQSAGPFATGAPTSRFGGRPCDGWPWGWTHSAAPRLRQATSSCGALGPSAPSARCGTRRSSGGSRPWRSSPTAGASPSSPRSAWRRSGAWPRNRRSSEKGPGELMGNSPRQRSQSRAAAAGPTDHAREWQRGGSPAQKRLRPETPRPPQHLPENLPDRGRRLRHGAGVDPHTSRWGLSHGCR